MLHRILKWLKICSHPQRARTCKNNPLIAQVAPSRCTCDRLAPLLRCDVPLKGLTTTLAASGVGGVNLRNIQSLLSLTATLQQACCSSCQSPVTSCANNPLIGGDAIPIGCDEVTPIVNCQAKLTELLSTFSQVLASTYV
eukprot:Platyproteum_vivax@DN7635_c0_g1_i2.p1